MNRRRSLYLEKFGRAEAVQAAAMARWESRMGRKRRMTTTEAGRVLDIRARRVYEKVATAIDETEVTEDGVMCQRHHCS